MANNAHMHWSGRIFRSDPLHHIGPGSRHCDSDPVAVMPTACIGLNAALVRIEGVRILQAGAGWIGVGLRLKDSNPASRLFEVFLTAGDGRDLVIALLDEDEAVACWRNAGKATSLPLLMQCADGSVTNPYPQIGAVALGPFHFRRQHSFLRHRRPRFLMRRKTGRVTLETVTVMGHELSRGMAR